MAIVAFLFVVYLIAWLLAGNDAPKSSKYEVHILYCPKWPDGEMEKRLEKWQNDGWEIAGQIKIGETTTGSFIEIPLKRLKK